MTDTGLGRRAAVGGPVIESSSVEPDYVDGLLDIEDHGDVVWLVWFRNHVIHYGDGVTNMTERRVSKITVVGKSVWNEMMMDLKAGRCSTTPMNA